MGTYQRRYERPSKFGGSFLNFGDLGLRAEKEKGDMLTKILEKEARETKERGEEGLAAFQGIAKTEKDNAQKLQALETDLANNEYRNIGIRADREVAALRAEAEQLEGEVKFWNKFSSTHAWNIGKSLTKTLETIDVVRGKALKDQMEARGDFDTQALLGKNMFGITDKAMQADKSGLLSAVTRGDDDAVDILNGVSRVRRTSNHWLSLEAYKFVTDNKEALFKDVQDDALELIKRNQQQEGATEWTTDQGVDEQGRIISGLGYESIALELHTRYAERLLREWGIEEGTEGARKIKAEFAKQGNLVHSKLYGKRKYTEGQQDLASDMKIWQSDPSNSDHFAAVVQQHAASWTTDGKGNYFPPTGNLADSIESIVVKAAGTAIDKHQAMDYLELQVPLRPGEDPDKPRQTVGERLAGRNIRESVEEAWLDNAKTRSQIANHTNKGMDSKMLTETEKLINDNPSLLTTEEGIAQLESAYNSAKAQGLNNTSNYIARILNYNKESKSSMVVQFQMRQAVKNGDYQLFNDTYLTLEEADQKKLDLDGTKKTMDFYRKHNRQLTTNKLNQTITSRLKAEIEGDQFGKGLHYTGERAVKELSLDVLNHLSNIINDEKYDGWRDQRKIDEAYKLAFEDVLVNEGDGTGKYRSIPPSGGDTGQDRRIFVHFLDDPTEKLGENTYKKEDLVTYLSETNSSLDGLLDRAINDEGSYLVDQDEMGEAAKDIANGGAFRMPENIKLIAEKFKGQKHEGNAIDQEYILNLIFERQGFSQRAKPGLRQHLRAMNVPEEKIEVIPEKDLEKVVAYEDIKEQTGQIAITHELRYALKGIYFNDAMTLEGIGPNNTHYWRSKRRMLGI